MTLNECTGSPELFLPLFHFVFEPSALFAVLFVTCLPQCNLAYLQDEETPAKQIPWLIPCLLVS